MERLPVSMSVTPIGFWYQGRTRYLFSLVRTYFVKKSALKKAIRDAETIEQREALQAELRQLRAEYRSERKGLRWLLF